ncbi:hypothetical protein D3C81_1762870 [compost metagenome]
MSLAPTVSVLNTPVSFAAKAWAVRRMVDGCISVNALSCRLVPSQNEPWCRKLKSGMYRTT